MSAHQDKLLVTGGSGMVGGACKSAFPQAEFITRKQFHDLSYDIRDKHIIHLAARVGGVKANTDYIADFYSENSVINEKILRYAHTGGAKKVVSLLSTCVYPDAPYIKYPLTEDQLHFGPPHSSNFGYAYAKRMVDVMSRAYRQQYGCNFITAIPNNLYGENDSFHAVDSHVIPALIRKVWEAKINQQNYVECWGDGTPLREFTYAQDIAKILLFLIENYDEPGPINIGNTDERSIKEVVEAICHIFEYTGEVVWNTAMPTGQFRKPSSNQRLLDLGWKEEWYTSLEEGLKNTCNWFKISYPNIRGVK
jgi:GDP-L-fucose synthase